MNTVTVRVNVIKGKRDEFLQTIRSLREELKQAEGFHKCRIYQDMTDESTFNVIEEWDTQVYLERHLHSDLFRVLLGALKVLSVDSEVTYHLVSTQGETKETEIL